MFLQLAHTKLDVYKFSQELTLECYRITKQFPNDEKFAMVQQIRRAALSVHLNLAEGCSRRSEAERSRLRRDEISRGSLIEIDAATGIAFKLSYATIEELQPLGNSIIKTFKILSGRSGIRTLTTDHSLLTTHYEQNKRHSDLRCRQDQQKTIVV